MSKSSEEFILNIQTQKTEDNPYIDNKSDNNSQYSRHSHRRRIDNIKYYEPGNTHSHILFFFSTVLISLYYCLVLRTERNFITEKLYHSFSLGIICLIDFSFSNSKPSEIQDERNSMKEALIEKSEKSTMTQNQSVLSNKEFLFFALTLGIISFCGELLTFYILNKATQSFNYNVVVGYALLSFEIIMIRLHYSMKYIKIYFINFIGTLMIFFVFIFISLIYLSIPLAGVAFLISFLKFVKFFFLMEIKDKSNQIQQRIILWLNVIDFLIGTTIIVISFISRESDKSFHFYFTFRDFMIILAASLCYYLNMKYFRDFDR